MADHVACRENVDVRVGPMHDYDSTRVCLLLVDWTLSWWRCFCLTMPAKPCFRLYLHLYPYTCSHLFNPLHCTRGHHLFNPLHRGVFYMVGRKSSKAEKKKKIRVIGEEWNTWRRVFCCLLYIYQHRKIKKKGCCVTIFRNSVLY